MLPHVCHVALVTLLASLSATSSSSPSRDSPPFVLTHDKRRLTRSIAPGAHLPSVGIRPGSVIFAPFKPDIPGHATATGSRVTSKRGASDTEKVHMSAQNVCKAVSDWFAKVS